MSEELTSSHVFVVTSLSNDAAVEGSFAWAMAQVESYWGDETPIIRFDASLDGETLGHLQFSYFIYNEVRFEVVEGASITLADKLYVYDGSLTLGAGITLETLWLQSGASLTTEAGTVIKSFNVMDYAGSPASIELHGTRVESTICVPSGTAFRADGCHFAAQKALELAVGQWDGTSVPACYANITNCSTVEGSYVSCAIEGLGAAGTVTWSSELAALLTPEGFSGAQIGVLVLKEGDTFIVPDGTVWEECMVSIENGATFSAGENCSISPNLSYDFGTSEEDKPTILVADGGTLSAEGLTVYGELHVSPTAAIEGTIVFADGARLCLKDWSGSTAQLKTVLAGATWSTASGKPLEVAIAPYGDVYASSYAPSGNVTLACLGEDFGPYVVPKNDMWMYNGTATFEKGAELLLEGAITVSDNYNEGTRGKLVFEGDNVVRLGEGCSVMESCIRFNGVDEEGIVLEAHGTRFEVMVALPRTSSPCVSGENIVFAAEVPLSVVLDSWDGTAASLQAALDTALEDTTYSISHPSARLGVSASELTADVVLSAESGGLPAGFTGLYFPMLSLLNGKNLTVEAGAMLQTDYAQIGHGALILEEGAILEQSLIMVSNGSWEMPEGEGMGRLEMVGVDLNGSTIQCMGGEVSLSGCYGKGELVLYATGEYNVTAGSVTISGCDLSQMDLSLLASTGSPDAPIVCDLSGNYWGTTDMEAVMAMIAGYDSAHIIINDLLTESPVASPEEDVTAPELTLSSPAIAGRKDGWATVTLSWRANEAIERYELRVDGELVELADAGVTTHTLRLEEGEHSYSLSAWDAAGNKTTQSDSFSFDATAPELTLKSPEIQKAGDGLIRLTFSWSGEKGAIYTIMVDGEPLLDEDGAVFTTTKTSHSVELKDGAHEYSITATDAAGNSTTVEGEPFSVDVSAPVFKVNAPEYTKDAASPGKALLTLSWTGESDGVTYTLRIDGKLKKLAPGQMGYSELLKDGAHEYSLTATDAAGNSRVKVGSFYLDATAPTLKVSNPKYTKAAEGNVEVTLSWSGELGATYTLEVDGETVYTGRDSSCRFITDDGEHRYTLTATDAAGNSTVKTGTLSYDATAPELSALRAEVNQASLAKGKGKVSFSWEGEEGATYTLMVDGKKAYSGKSTSKTLSLKDGEHSYSVIAKDKAGNSVEVEGGSFSFDATAPTITLDTPEIVYGAAYAQGPGNSFCFILRWDCNESDAVPYRVLVMRNGELYYDSNAIDYPGSGWVTSLGDGRFEFQCYTNNSTESPTGKVVYTYSITMVDAAGNPAGEKKGSITTPAYIVTPCDPVVSNLTHSVKAGKNGTVSATLSWAGEKGSTYTLMVDGAIVYVGSATKRTLTLDGSVPHTYSVVATDKVGTRGEEVTGSIDYSTLAVSHELEKVTTTSGRKTLTTTTATLSWEAVEGVDYVLKVGGKVVAHDGDSYEWTGRKDGKHSYTLSATDQDGNTITTSGSFVADTKAPKLSLSKPKYSKAGEGLMNVTLSWKGEKGATYMLFVDGETKLIDSTATSYTLRGIKDGAHHYSVIATDGALYTCPVPGLLIGNGNDADGEFSYDATAPDIILGAISGTAVTSKGTTRTLASFDWVGEDGVSYTVKVDGKKLSVKKLTEKQIINGKSTTVTLSTLSVTTGKLAAGTHSYVITTKDKAGNVSEISGVFTSDVEGTVVWGDGEEAVSTTALPQEAVELCFTGETDSNEDGFSAPDAPMGYRFELTEARQLIVELDDLRENATVVLQKEGGQGSIELAANAMTGLDRELSLSAGSYWLQVLGSDGSALAADSYTLDLELEKNGSKQPMQQGILA